MSKLVTYPIRAVARMTGLSVDTLRAWERRYQAVMPVRDARGRAYTADHVARLKRLAALVDTGHAIGRVAPLPDAALDNLLPKETAPPKIVSRQAADLAPLLEAIKQYDLAGAEAALSRNAVVLTPHDLIFSVVLPVLRQTGDRWASGAIRPSHEHLLSAMVRSVLGGVLRTLPRRPRASVVVMAAPSGERHELGVLCAAVLAAGAGLDAMFLGPDLPATDIVHAATHTKARAVLLGATTPSAVRTAEWRALARIPDSVDVWVGGPQASVARQALGSRLRTLDRLEDVTETFERYA
jgi:DNA-binding transcriptional MerR regulator